MSTSSPAPLVSPDGRFEVRVEEFYERASPTITTHVYDRSAGDQIFTCIGAPTVEFTAEGMLIVRYPGYEPNGIVIDPRQRCFRTHDSDPWVPLAAWPLVESAYTRGWSAAFRFRQTEAEASGTGVEAALFCISIAALLLILRFGSSLPREARIVLVLVSAAAAFFFAWLWLNAVRHCRRIRSMRDPRAN